MTQVKIVPVTDKRGLKTFVELPWSIYNSKDHPQWVPPLRLAVYESLDTKKNPFYKRADIQLFLAEKDGKPVGRIAAIENRAHNEFHGDRAGFYGFFEAIDDQDVATALFNAAGEWLKKRD